MIITAPCENKEEIHYKPFCNVDAAQRTINFFNDKSDSHSTNSQQLVGGKDQEWKNVLEKLGQNYVEHPQPLVNGEVMGDLEYVKTLNRFDCPIKLDPNTASFIDVGIHAVLRQRLQKSTVEKHLRYARFMENHLCSVDFRNPSLENFIRHMDYREQIENAGPHALVHEWKTMKTFLKAYGMPIWDYKPPSAPKSHKRILPFPDIVYKFFHYKYSKDDYETTLYQYLFYGYIPK